MPEFERPYHRAVLTALQSLDADFLDEAQCFFGGGTQLAMTFGEYRESRDMDFLCSSREGFRLLREQVSQDSLGVIGRRPLSLAREVRADRDGIRTFIDVDGARIKFEILLEANDGFVVFGKRGALAGLAICFKDVSEGRSFAD